MQQHTTARVALIRAIGAAHLRPMVDTAPLDSMPAGEAAGGGDGGDAGTDGGGSGTGGQDPTGTGGAGDQAGDGSGDGPGEVTPPLFQAPTPSEVAPPENATPAPKAPAERSIEDFPREIQDYIRALRTESAESRVKAKTAAEEAEQRIAAQQEEWVGNLLKATGLMPDVEEFDDDDSASDPAEQVQQLTGQVQQLTDDHRALTDDHRAVSLELAIWKGAHQHQGNPVRLTDSRSFMRDVAKLDPSADDFASKVAAAIGTAVETDPYYRAEAAAGQAPPTPPVPSGGDFAGGPSGQHTEPQSVDDYRTLLRKNKNKRGGGSD